MAFQIKPASRTQSKLRLAVFGPSGSGKTMTSLRLAYGLGGPVGVIDTERGSAAKYSDRWAFDVIELPDYSIDTYVGAIHAFADAGHQVLVIDSLSHGWEWLLDWIDKLGATKYKGNKWSAWSEGTPKQQSLVDAFLTYPGHVIATMRSKTEWVQEQTPGSKAKPVRIGMAPKQRDGLEYEFDMLMELNTDNIGRIIKDRSGKFQEALIEKPGEDFGRQLGAWLSEGAPPLDPPTPPVHPPAPTAPSEPEGPKVRGIRANQLKDLAAKLQKHGLTDKDMTRGFIAWAIDYPLLAGAGDMTEEDAAQLLGWSDDDWSERLVRYADHLNGGPPDDLPAAAPAASAIAGEQAQLLPPASTPPTWPDPAPKSGGSRRRARRG